MTLCKRLVDQANDRRSGPRQHHGHRGAASSGDALCRTHDRVAAISIGLHRSFRWAISAHRRENGCEARIPQSAHSQRPDTSLRRHPRSERSRHLRSGSRRACVHSRRKLRAAAPEPEVVEERTATSRSSNRVSPVSARGDLEVRQLRRALSSSCACSSVRRRLQLAVDRRDVPFPAENSLLRASVSKSAACAGRSTHSGSSRLLHDAIAAHTP